MGRQSVNEFLGHKTNAGKGAFLDKWKERTPPRVNVWLSKVSPFGVRWVHSFPRAFRKDDGENVVWSAQYVCREDEKVLIKQYKREDDDTRLLPPCDCGICKMLEWIYQEIVNGRLSWTEKLFVFEGDNPKETRELFAGGMVGMFGDKNLTEQQKRELRQNGIFIKDAWKQVCWPKAQYVFCLVDHDAPGEGVVIDMEAAALGDKVKGVIRDRMTEFGEDEGNPCVTPYALQFQYYPDEEMNKRYKVVPMSKLQLVPEIDDLITNDPPETDHLYRGFNINEVRAALEKAAQVQLPWDDWFPREHEQEQAEQEPRDGEDSPPVRFRPRPTEQKPAAKPRIPEQPREPEPKQEAEPPVRTRAVRQPKPAPKKPQVQCGGCGKENDEDASKCVHCGAVFDDEPEEAPPPKAAPKAAPKAKQAETSEFDLRIAGEDDDEIPFG